MANGDEAAAVGMDVVAGTDDIRQGYDEVNKSRDYLAQHRTSGTHDASQIASGVLHSDRGGTGQPNVYLSPTDADVSPNGTFRLVAASENGPLRGMRGGTIDPAYLGFQVYATQLANVDFNNDGDASVEHGCPFDPQWIMVQGRADQVYVTTRAIDPPWDATVVLLRARSLIDGTPWPGEMRRIILFAIGSA